MLVAVVTGGVSETTAVADRLERHGFEVHRAVAAECPVPTDRRLLRPIPEGPAPADAQTGWARLVWRLDVLAVMARCLGPRATVILAVKNVEPSPPGESHDLLAAFAAVVLEGAGRVDVRVVVVPAAELAGSERVSLTAADPVEAFT